MAKLCLPNDAKDLEQYEETDYVLVWTFCRLL